MKEGENETKKKKEIREGNYERARDEKNRQNQEQEEIGTKEAFFFFTAQKTAQRH